MAKHLKIAVVGKKDKAPLEVELETNEQHTRLVVAGQTDEVQPVVEEVMDLLASRIGGSTRK
jgi:hypothetical protein